jgi:L-lactate dehydrogenase complex protein LldF
MSVQEAHFLKNSAQKAQDIRHREIIQFNMGKYDAAVTQGLQHFDGLETAKKKAHVIKWRVMENLDKYLHEFETNCLAKGGKVIWANDAEEALEEIGSILDQVKAKKVVKSKSMTTEEIELNAFLSKRKIETIETDLGEFIVQQLGQKPYHIVTPAMHLSRKEIAQLFHEKFGTPEDAPAEALTAKARELMRQHFTEAEVGITGGNFLLADSGSIALTENEGNARLSTCFPKIHIAIVGIEKIIPSLKDLPLFWPLLSSHGTGQQLTVYNSIIGPKQPHEGDGPEEFYVVLLDNGRSQLLAQKEQRQGLYCIRCGACLNACPVYRNIGGHAYETTYSGPIGSVITPHMKGMDQFKHLSQASSLCGKCTEVCPVKIDIHQMLLLNRKEAVDQGKVSYVEKTSWKLATRLLLKRSRLDQFGGKIKNLILRLFFRKLWNKARALPKVAPTSFSAQWLQRQKQSDKEL